MTRPSTPPPLPPDARLIISEGNYLLLPDGDWPRVRFDEVWFCDLDPDERLRRLVARHERFGKDPAAALAWATGTDQHNADLIDATRSRATFVVPGDVMRALPADSTTPAVRAPTLPRADTAAVPRQR